ncbi:MAG: hypothetical protein LBL33_10720 [Tannerella sp.]|nr:hypothetical protein [Tannerella sp.]
MMRSKMLQTVVTVASQRHARDAYLNSSEMRVSASRDTYRGSVGIRISGLSRYVSRRTDGIGRYYATRKCVSIVL